MSSDTVHFQLIHQGKTQRFALTRSDLFLTIEQMFSDVCQKVATIVGTSVEELQLTWKDVNSPAKAPPSIPLVTAGDLERAIEFIKEFDEVEDDEEFTPLCIYLEVTCDTSEEETNHRCCGLCSIRLDETAPHFKCPSKAKHTYCCDCTRTSLKQKYTKKEIGCPSGEKCTVKRTLTPWSFTPTMLQEYLGEEFVDFMKNRQEARTKFNDTVAAIAERETHGESKLPSIVTRPTDMDSEVTTFLLYPKPTEEKANGASTSSMHCEDVTVNFELTRKRNTCSFSLSGSPDRILATIRKRVAGTFGTRLKIGWKVLSSSNAICLPLETFDDFSRAIEAANNSTPCIKLELLDICCTLCDEPLEDVEFHPMYVECPSNPHHNFCARCTRIFIRKHARDTEINCPSGERCLFEGKPWDFWDPTIERILREEFHEFEMIRAAAINEREESAEFSYPSECTMNDEVIG